MITQTLERAKEVGFVIPRNDRERSTWYRWCKENNHPFVVVKRKRKYSRVTFDLITTDYWLREKHRDELFQLWRNLAWGRTFRKLEAICGFETGAFIVPIEIDEAMAFELVKRLRSWRDSGEVETWQERLQRRYGIRPKPDV
jgi:hypothetical protein